VVWLLLVSVDSTYERHPPSDPSSASDSSREPGGGPAGRGGHDASQEKENLKQLAKQTGGSYFEVGKKESLEQIYRTIEEELRSQYSLGYTPDARAVDGYRTIKVGVTRTHATVRAREGYYARNRQGGVRYPCC
jgi:VWFA-related protein